MPVTVHPAPANGTSVALVEPMVPQTQYRRGREWVTKFDDAAADAAVFTLSGFTYTTDGSDNVLALTDPAVESTIFTKEMLSDCEVLVRWRPTVQAPYNLGNVTPKMFLRYQDVNNTYRVFPQFTGGQTTLGSSIYDGAATNVSGGPTDGTTNDTDDRFLRARITGDCLRFKQWFVTEREPSEWDAVARIRKDMNQPTVQIGLCGFSLRYGGIIKRLYVAELIRTDDNALITPHPTDVETTDGLPVGWTKSDADTATKIRDIVNVTDRVGNANRPVFHLQSTSEAGCLWQQNVFRRSGMSAFGQQTAKHPFLIDFPELFEVSVWTKASNIARAGATNTTLGAVIVVYYYDNLGTTLNSGLGNYYHTLGPGGLRADEGPRDTNDKRGLGSWDWTLTRWYLPVVDAQAVENWRFQIGFHDPCTGDLWFSEPVVRSVA